MKEIVKLLNLILLSLFVFSSDSRASEFSLRFAHIQEPVNHTLLTKKLTADLNKSGRVSDTSRKDIMDFRKLAKLLLNDEESGEYSLHSSSNKNIRDDQPVIPFHKRSDKYTSLSEDTKYLALILGATSAALYMMPEELTNWSREGMKGTNVFERWKRHIKSKPVWDGDHWAVNYIGHPYAGSAYYTLARQRGLDWKEAGLYTTFVSTFMWEYGVELTGEVPSIQDLIITPIGGVILGEILLSAEDVIIRNNGKILGSKLVGDIALVLIDPFGSGINLLKRWTDIPARINIRAGSFNTLSGYRDNRIYDMGADTIPLPYYGMRLVFTYE